LPPGRCFVRYATVSAGSPVLIVPRMWIGDFVRCHGVVCPVRELARNFFSSVCLVAAMVYWMWSN
jgi:hypothetical protein